MLYGENLSEEVVSVAQRFMVFSNAQWSILANLFQASSVLHNLQADSTELNLKVVKAHADINELMFLTISTFNEIISKIGEYCDLSEDAFAFLTDDLERAISLSDQIAKGVNDGYTDAVKGGVTVLKNKLKEIGEKVKRHLKTGVGENSDGLHR